MSSWLRDGTAPPPRALEIIIGHFDRVACPTYLGAISLEVGWSLARTQEMVTVLVHQGLVRELSIDEKRAMGGDADHTIYVRVSKAA